MGRKIRSVLMILSLDIKRATLVVNPETVLKKQRHMKKSVEKGSIENIWVHKQKGRLGED